jgi:hypothetical protein
MIERVLLCLLLSGLAWAQGTDSNPQLKSRPSLASPANTLPATAANVAADAPVITIAGSCEHAAGATPQASECKTVITRAQFEDLVNAIAPGMPATARKQFAGRYALALVMSQKAQEMGIDHGPRFDELMKIARMQVLAQLLNQTLQQKAGDISAKDIEDYYQKNITAYQQVGLERIFVPRAQQLEPPTEKLTPEATAKRRKDSEEQMKDLADKLHARAVAGEDFAKLQGEAYQAAGFKNTPPPPKMTDLRRSNLPPAQAVVFDLKTGEISSVIADTSGYYIYKVGSKQTLPLPGVHDEIFGLLRSQRVQDSMQGVQQSATPTLNQEYFGDSAVPAPAGRSLGPK